MILAVVHGNPPTEPLLQRRITLTEYGIGLRVPNHGIAITPLALPRGKYLISGHVLYTG